MILSRFEKFDPNNCSQEQLNYLADHIENYLTVLTKTMIIPEEVEEEHGKDIAEGIRRARKLIKKLRKGDVPLNLDYA